MYFADNFQEFATLNAVYEEIFKLHIFIESRQEYEKDSFIRDCLFFCQCFRRLNSYRNRLSCYLTRTFWAWTLLTWLAFKQYNSWTDPFWKRSTSLYVWWTYKARFLPKLSSQNTAFCHEERAMPPFSSPAFMVYAWNTWDHDPLLATKTPAFYDSGFPTEGRVITDREILLSGQLLG